MSQQNSRIRRNKYKEISQQQRLEIIERIIKNGQQLKTVSEQIGINVSTCKAIIKVYTEEGRVGKKKTRNKVIDVVQTYSFYVLENSKLTELCPLKIMNSKVSVEQKELIDDIVEQKCKNKAEKLLTQAVETHKKVQDAMKQTQLANDSFIIQNSANFFPFYYQPL